MANLVIECPACKKPIQASTGLFSKKKIRCGCGYVIDVNAERMTQKICPHCGNTVVYDRKKSQSASCPVCHTRINAGNEMVRITCPACKIELTADKNADTYTCPQCKTLIDVQARLAQENSSGKTSVIKWDMGINDIFVYRHPVENFNIGSQLIVSEGQKALFFRNGKGLDVFGPGRHTLETQKLPLLAEVLKFPTDTELTFDSKVYFIRTNRLPVKWGVPSIQLRNPEMDFYVNIGVSGSFDVEVIDDNESVRKLVYMIMGSSSGTEHKEALGGGQSYTAQYMTEKFRDVVATRFSDILANIIIENGINVLDIETKKIVLSNILRDDFNGIFEEYGLIIPEKHFNLTTIRIHNSEDVARWKSQEAERVLRTREEGVRKAEAEARQGRILVEEETKAKSKITQAQGESVATKIYAEAASEARKFEAQGEAEAIKLKGQASAEAYSARAKAEAEEMRLKNYTYQQETSRQLGMEALKHGLPGTGAGGGQGAASGLGSALGDMVGLGVGLSAMGSAVNLTKDIVKPIIGDLSSVSKNITQPDTVPSQNGWNCSCGKEAITSKFCPDCGAKRPQDKSSWTCPSCGLSEITSKFCPDCGQKGGE